MNKKEIVININEQGDCSLEANGFFGPECEKLMGEIEKALGVVVSSKKKPEYCQRATTNNRNNQKTLN